MYIFVVVMKIWRGNEKGQGLLLTLVLAIPLRAARQDGRYQAGAVTFGEMPPAPLSPPALRRGGMIFGGCGSRPAMMSLICSASMVSHSSKALVIISTLSRLLSSKVRAKAYCLSRMLRIS